MSPTARLETSLFFLLLLLSSLSARADELRLKSEALCSGAIVRLGDLVEQEAGMNDIPTRLLGLELFATPPLGQSRTVRAKEIRELLTLHGIEINALRITGAEAVEIQSSKTKSPSYLKQVAHEKAVAQNDIQVVAPTRTISPGQTIRQGDVELRLVARVTKGLRYATRIEDVLGRETTRQLEPTQPIDIHWLQQPLLVRRGETIMVISRAAGVQVRTSAKAMEDGAKGDSIVVEELDGKKRQKFSARVSGFQEAEIFAGVTNVVSNPQPR